MLVADPDKVAAVDPVTNHITFRNVDPNPGLSEDQGKLIDTPALADIDGSGKPEIIVGSNEEYPVGTGDEGQLNVSPTNSLLTSAIGRAGVLKMANGRVYAIRSDRLAGPTESVPARLAAQDRDHRRRSAARRGRGHQRLAGRRARALPVRRHRARRSG